MANESVRAIDILTLVPFVLPAKISTTKPTKCGRGVIVPLTAAQNAAVTAQHNLGRPVQVYWPLINNAGASVPPLLTLTAPSTNNSQGFVATNVAMTNCLVFMA